MRDFLEKAVKIFKIDERLNECIRIGDDDNIIIRKAYDRVDNKNISFILYCSFATKFSRGMLLFYYRHFFFIDIHAQAHHHTDDNKEF